MKILSSLIKFIIHIFLINVRKILVPYGEYSSIMVRLKLMCNVYISLKMRAHISEVSLQKKLKSFSLIARHYSMIVF